VLFHRSLVLVPVNHRITGTWYKYSQKRQFYRLY
jgi:hypothetical protein